jgi:beta-glucanase (GH16 family)
MRGFVLVLAVAVGCTPATAARTSAAPPPDGWIQVWADEFDGASGAIDTTKWRHDTADGCASSNCGWGNNEKQYYSTSRDNIAVDGQGRLVIVARQAPLSLDCYYGACRYTSAKITTRGKLDVAPGRVAARIKLPVGQGLWPAFWMLGRNIASVGWPASGELDIMENRGSDASRTSSAVHGPGYSGNTPFVHARELPPRARSDAFHTYAVEWDSLHIRYFVDDTVHYAVSRSDVQRYGDWVFDQPFYLLLNLAVGGNFDGDPQSDSILPATMVVDYVRVFRRARATGGT